MPRLATDLTDLEAQMLRRLLENAPIGDYGILIAKLLPLLPVCAALDLPILDIAAHADRREELARKHRGDKDQPATYLDLLRRQKQ